MTNRTCGQCLSNMLPRLFVALTLTSLVQGTVGRTAGVHAVEKEPSYAPDCRGNGECGILDPVGDVSSRDRPGESRRSRKHDEGLLEDGDDGSEEVTGRKKDKDKGDYGGLLWYAFGAMKIMLLYGMMYAVGALAAKALVVAKVGLAIATAAALKKASDHEKVSYEIVKHPQHSYIQTHSSSIDYDHGDHQSGWEHGSYGYRKRRRAT